MSFTMFLLLLSGVAWTIVYFDGIRIGIKDKSYAIPFWALALNFTWELLHSILGAIEVGFDAQIIVNIVWVLCDIGILYTYFKYGMKYFPKNRSRNDFILWSVGGIIVSFMLQYMFMHEFTLVIGRSYAAFLQNLLMAILFIVMLVQRDSSEGQTMLIAWCKFIGTLAPTLYFGVVGHPNFNNESNMFILVIGVMTAIFYVSYIIMLGNQKRKERA